MLRRLIGAFDRFAVVVACALVIALLVVVSLGVITRSMGEPLIWTDELSRILMVWLAAFGWVLASRRRLHVRIRFFQGLLAPPLHRAVEIALQFAVTLFGALICGYGVGLVIRNHDLEATTMPLSMAWLYVPIALAGAVTALQGARETWDAIRHGPAGPPRAGDAVPR
jgi:TRAP-type C4-dicarboxylate transport system permease small subunit